MCGFRTEVRVPRKGIHMNILRTGGVTAVLSLVFTGAMATPAPAQAQQDGLVNVAVGDVTILEDVNVGVAAQVAAQVCGVKVGPVAVLGQAVDRSGATRTVCQSDQGAVGLWGSVAGLREGGVSVNDARPETRFDDQAIVDLVPTVRKVVGARIRDPHVVDDLVQETLTRVMAAHERVEADTLAPYAAVTARNLMASFAQRNDRARNTAHLLADPDLSAPPGDDLLRQEERSVVGAALARLPSGDRDMLIAHEVEAQDTKTLAADRGSTPGAAAAQLSRTRAKLRVEYLFAQEHIEPPSDRCRPVLQGALRG